MRIKRLLSAIALCLIIAILSPTAAYAETPTESTGVQNLTLTLSADRAYLTWDAYPSASGYKVYYDSGSGPVYYTTTTGKACRISSLTAVKKYTFYVYIISSGNVVYPTAASISGWTCPKVPSYTISKAGNSCILSWSAVTGADSYEVLTRLPDETEWTVKDNITKTTYSFTPGVDEMYVGVRAVMIKDEKEYRGDFRKKLYSTIQTDGSMISFGDSVASGTGSQYYAYPEMLARSHRLSLQNYAIGGATLSYLSTERCICDDVTSHITSSCDCDYIIINGGDNDYSYNLPVGQVTPYGTTEFDKYTVCGALEIMFSHIQKTAPDTKVIFVMIHEVTTSYTKTNALGLNFVDYKNGISSVCEKYGVPIADVSAVMSTRDTVICKKYTSTRLGVYPNGDGVHPNELGYETYYMPVIEAVLFPAAQPTEEPTSGQTRLLGDADGDGNISIVDATMIQRRLASYTVPDPEIVDQIGDIDGDGLSITDATYIQRYLAQYTVPYGIGQPIV